ncbi:alpha/beta hydrolase [Glacieibacterium frigidum]|uniref:Alpha/beta hydrolase n=1 Tax=Glacieibacterium frigidum TaxID=2593303 RepID=A0A552UAG6_9SPHN|nr:alpha/beta hydrolase [Glacieibacterium frigidum]TRW15202.1 alpha/beta hydrolase [Glacieibacterium frigidum]
MVQPETGRWLIMALAIVVAAVALVLGVAFAFQRSLIYPVGRAPAPPAVGATPGYRDIVFATADGLQLRALYRPARGRPTIVFFHGNADGLAGGVAAMRGLAAADYGVLIPEYRGYAGQPGRISEAGLYADGAGALAWLAQAGVPPGDTVLIGNSLGSGIAVELATRRRDWRALVIVSGFTSLPDAVAATFGIGLLRPLVRDRYASAAKLRGIGLPVLILHGDADRVIGVDHGIALAKAAGTVASLRIVPGAGHDLVWYPATATTIADWLS